MTKIDKNMLNLSLSEKGMKVNTGKGDQQTFKAFLPQETMLPEKTATLKAEASVKGSEKSSTEKMSKGSEKSSTEKMSLEKKTFESSQQTTAIIPEDISENIPNQFSQDVSGEAQETYLTHKENFSITLKPEAKQPETKAVKFPFSENFSEKKTSEIPHDIKLKRNLEMLQREDFSVQILHAPIKNIPPLQHAYFLGVEVFETADPHCSQELAEAQDAPLPEIQENCDITGGQAHGGHSQGQQGHAGHEKGTYAAPSRTASSFTTAEARIEDIQNFIHQFHCKLDNLKHIPCSNDYKIPLTHKELGKVNIKFSFKEKKVSATFMAENQALRDVLALHKVKLEKALKDNGFEASDLHFFIENNVQHHI